MYVYVCLDTLYYYIYTSLDKLIIFNSNNTQITLWIYTRKEY